MMSLAHLPRHCLAPTPHDSDEEDALEECAQANTSHRITVLETAPAYTKQLLINIEHEAWKDGAWQEMPVVVSGSAHQHLHGLPWLAVQQLAAHTGHQLLLLLLLLV